VKFASRVYLIAGIIGLLEIIPLFFTEALLGRTYPPLITHPEFYYGFAGVTLAWQVLFLMLSRDPLRYRPLMLPTILEKAAYVVAAIVLVALERMSPEMLGSAVVDAILGALFLTSYLRTAGSPTVQEKARAEN